MLALRRRQPSLRAVARPVVLVLALLSYPGCAAAVYIGAMVAGGLCALGGCSEGDPLPGTALMVTGVVAVLVLPQAAAFLGAGRLPVLRGLLAGPAGLAGLATGVAVALVLPDPGVVDEALCTTTAALTALVVLRPPGGVRPALIVAVLALAAGVVVVSTSQQVAATAGAFIVAMACYDVLAGWSRRAPAALDDQRQEAMAGVRERPPTADGDEGGIAVFREDHGCTIPGMPAPDRRGRSEK